MAHSHRNIGGVGIVVVGHGSPGPRIDSPQFQRDPYMDSELVCRTGSLARWHKSTAEPRLLGY